MCKKSERFEFPSFSKVYLKIHSTVWTEGEAVTNAGRVGAAECWRSGTCGHQAAARGLDGTRGAKDDGTELTSIAFTLHTSHVTIVGQRSSELERGPEIHAGTRFENFLKSVF